MRKQLTFATMLLFILTGIAAGCKKESGESRSLKKKMEGKWQVSKIETTIDGTATKVYTGAAADFFEFRNDENDQVEVGIAGDRILGTYAVFATDDFSLSLSGKILNSTTNTITDNNFEFTATVQDANPKEVRKYFLRR
ncbi:hypothetical protein [Pedobacter gandavensis]|uniref:hypothetical protein n=1 Tax=Pedobacter gandavensis TaxID=2679963 RepID=UPI0029309FB8|nr:hypothetical protein [Pedobacter gandavensis]